MCGVAAGGVVVSGCWCAVDVGGTVGDDGVGCVVRDGVGDAVTGLCDCGCWHWWRW